MNEPYQNLANAIVLKAFQDYKDLYTNTLEKDDEKSYNISIQELKNFFRSSWYQTLSNGLEVVKLEDELELTAIKELLEKLEGLLDENFYINSKRGTKGLIRIPKVIDVYFRLALEETIKLLQEQRERKEKEMG